MILPLYVLWEIIPAATLVVIFWSIPGRSNKREPGRPSLNSNTSDLNDNGFYFNIVPIFSFTYCLFFQLRVNSLIMIPDMILTSTTLMVAILLPPMQHQRNSEL